MQIYNYDADQKIGQVFTFSLFSESKMKSSIPQKKVSTLLKNLILILRVFLFLTKYRVFEPLPHHFHFNSSPEFAGFHSVTSFSPILAYFA
jgi:hypothetical protein